MTTSTISKQIRQEAAHYLFLHRYDVAKEKYMECLQQEPKNHQVMVAIAVCAMNLKDYETAVHFCKTAIEIDPAYELSYFILGDVCFMQKRFVESERVLLDGLSLYPNSVNLLCMYAYLMLATGFEEKAKTLMAEAKALDPENATVLRYQFNFELAFLETAKSEQTITRLMEKNANQMEMLMKMGRHAFQSRDYKMAREKYHECFLLDPTNEDVLKQLRLAERLCHPIFILNRTVWHPIGRAALFLLPLLALTLRFLVPQNPMPSDALNGVFIMVMAWLLLSGQIYKVFMQARRIWTR